MKQRYIFLAGTILSCTACGTSSQKTEGCSISSDDTLLFDEALTGAGRYDFSLEIAGQKGSCEVVLTESGTEKASCNPSSWYVIQTDKGKSEDGKIVPISPTDVLGLLIGSDGNESISLKVEKDGSLIFEGSATLALETVEDDGCGEVERRAATIELP